MTWQMKTKVAPTATPAKSPLEVTYAEVQKSIEGVRDPEMRAILKGLLASLSPQPDKLASVPSWMQPIVRQIAGGYLGEDHD